MPSKALITDDSSWNTTLPVEKTQHFRTHNSLLRKVRDFLLLTTAIADPFDALGRVEAKVPENIIGTHTVSALNMKCIQSNVAAGIR